MEIKKSRIIVPGSIESKIFQSESKIFSGAWQLLQDVLQEEGLIWREEEEYNKIQSAKKQAKYFVNLTRN